MIVTIITFNDTDTLIARKVIKNRLSNITYICDWYSFHKYFYDITSIATLWALSPRPYSRNVLIASLCETDVEFTVDIRFANRFTIFRKYGIRAKLRRKLCPRPYSEYLVHSTENIAPTITNATYRIAELGTVACIANNF